jgi:ribosomal protein L24E
MSYLYRHALFVSRRQAYIDWANGLDDDGPELAEDLSQEERNVYLVPESAQERDLGALLDEFWEDIFDAELSSWTIAEESWPPLRTREMFNQWFDVELNASVYDLVPEEPLTQAQVDLEDLAEASERCAACGLDVEQGEGRFVGFKLADRSRFELFQGRVWPLPVDDEESVLCIVTTEGSEDARAGDDLLVRACSSRCEKVIRRIVTPALRKWSRRLESALRS